MSKISAFLIRLLPCFALLSAWAPSAMAQNPANQITIVVPYAPGGPSDSVARMLRPVFERVLGKTTIVENVGGAGGSIGASKVLRVVDGSQILLATPNEVILAPIGLAAVKYKPDAFRLVGTVGELPYALIARPDFPAASIDELIAYSKANATRPLSYGSMGQSSLNHLATEALRAETGISINHIPYRGSAPLLQDVLAGQIDFALTPLAGNVQAMIETKKLKFYGVTSINRSARLKDWPTVNEGKQLKNFAYSIWFGPAVSKDTPEVIVKNIRAAVAEALLQPEIRQGLADLGFTGTAVNTTAEANKLYIAEQGKFRSIATALKLLPEQMGSPAI